jgi:chromate transporter
MIYLDLLLGFLKVGCFAFGGAYGAIPLIRDVVLSYGWLSEEMLTYMIAVSESTPGPIMVNLATMLEAARRDSWFGHRNTCSCSSVLYHHSVGDGAAQNCTQEQYVQGVLKELKPWYYRVPFCDRC